MTPHNHSTTNTHSDLAAPVPQLISPVLIKALYGAMENEEARWSRSGFDDRTGTASILSALQHLKNRGTNLNPQDPEELAEVIKAGCCIARWMFRRRSKRRYARRKAKGISEVSTNFATAATASTKTFEFEKPFYVVIDATFDYIDMLRAAGLNGQKAYAIVRRFQGAEWEDIQDELLDAGYAVQGTTLRQWYSRLNVWCRKVITSEFSA